MVILGIESSAQSASACVVKDSKVLSEYFLNVGLTHSVTLMPLVKQAMEGAGMSVGDLDGIAVANGPGSFTGVRIGVATAKGIAVPADIKCIPVSTLEVIAYPLIDSECIAAAVMDARCSQVYCGLYDCHSSSMESLTEDSAFSLSELAEKLKAYDKKIILIGDGADISYEYLKDKISGVYKASSQYVYQKSSSAALIGEKRLINNENVCSAEELVPAYLRLPQAERELKKKKEKKQ